jgi:hypothetical protein
MTKLTKIRVPYFIDDPILAPCPTISPLPFGTFTFGINADYIIIENEKLIYKASKMSIFSNRSFDLSEIDHLVVLSKKVTCWKKDFSLDMWGRLGTDIKLDLLDSKGGRHPLIQRFFMLSTGTGQKVWEKFLEELRSCLKKEIIEDDLS